MIILEWNGMDEILMNGLHAIIDIIAVPYGKVTTTSPPAVTKPRYTPLFCTINPLETRLQDSPNLGVTVMSRYTKPQA